MYVAYYGADVHASGDPSKVPISRGVPVEKALEDESLIAWAMNGEDIPHMNGYPLRLVIAGWPGSVAGKWLNKIVVRNQVHDGPKMTGTSYRVPCKPVAPGTTVPDDEMCIIESMPVKSLITFPKSGIEHAVGDKLALRGHAWAGDPRCTRSARVDRLRRDLDQAEPRTTRPTALPGNTGVQKSSFPRSAITRSGPEPRTARAVPSRWCSWVESQGLSEQRLPPHRRTGRVMRHAASIGYWELPAFLALFADEPASEPGGTGTLVGLSPSSIR